MSKPNLLIIVIDGWRASALGAYGNSGLPTPACDKLASESLLLDNLLCDSVELPQFYQSLWNARHSLRPQADDYWLLKHFAEQGWRTRLITDEAWLAETAEGLPLEQLSFLDLAVSHAASSVEATACGQLFAVAGEQLAGSEGEESCVTWIHARGFHGPWDAPQEYRESRLTEGDPPPLGMVEPPKLLESDDPDELLQYRTAYDAQMAVLDECLGDFFVAAESNLSRRPTLVVLMGARGFCLGEHGALGTEARSLYGENLYVPCLLLSPQINEPIPRFQGLAQPMDLCATIADWMRVESRSGDSDGRSLLPVIDADLEDWRQWALAASASENALRTPAWAMRTGGQRAELFVKPDDRWECNEVADRCPDVLAEMHALQARLQQAVETGVTFPAERLDTLLVRPDR